MSTFPKALFSAVVLMMIYSVGIVQAVVEKQRGEPIQVLDIFTDTFLTPFRRLNKAADELEKVSAKLHEVKGELEKGKQLQTSPPAAVRSEGEAAADDAGGIASQNVVEWDSYAAEVLVEEATVFAGRLAHVADSVNKHKLADSLSRFYKDMHGLDNEITAYYTGFADKSDDIDGLVDGVDELIGKVAAVKAKYPRPGPVRKLWLPIEYFFHHTGFNSRYLRGYEKEMETKSVFSLVLRPPMQFFRYISMRDLGSKGIFGDKGWFFYKPGYEYLVKPYIYDPRSVEVDANDSRYTDDPVKAVLTFRRQLKNRGIDMLFVLVPGKASIYPDLMSDRISPDMAGKISHSTRFLATLSDSGVDVVDLFSVLGEERTHDEEAGDSTYMKKDTHWRARGLRAAAAAVANRVKQYPWYREGTTEYTIEQTSVMRDGDVGIMSKLPDFKMGSFGIRFEMENVPCFKVYEVARDGDGGIVSTRLYLRQKKNRSDIILIGDSFTRIFQHDAPTGAGWVAHLAVELKQPVFYDYSDGGSSTLMRQKLARNPDWLDGKKLLIWEVVERDVRFGAEGWADVDL